MTETLVELSQHNAEIVRLNSKLRYTQQQLSNRNRDLAEVSEALRPFAALADVCDHFKRLPDQTICSWRIAGERQRGPTADDCRNARTVLNATDSRDDVSSPPRGGE